MCFTQLKLFNFDLFDTQEQCILLCNMLQCNMLPLILYVMPCLPAAKCICLAVLLPITISHAHHLAVRVYFWISLKLNKEFNEPIPRPPSGLENP